MMNIIPRKRQERKLLFSWFLFLEQLQSPTQPQDDLAFQSWHTLELRWLKPMQHHAISLLPLQLA
jgi:hypothetical protein